ncbi:helix-turn-helix domain-containing protein, partial [Bifidobacterium breve]
FAKAFREIVGTSPNEYVTRLRVIRAKYLLSLTDLTVLQISKDCGYRSQSTFGAMFKRSIGVTPSEYRSQLIISNLSD